jgi:hypothetical protein
MQMSEIGARRISFSFPLQVEDGWPPVAVEGLPFEQTADGFRVLVAPLFVKNLSVGDVISIETEADDLVKSWHHVIRSKRTTIWILRLQDSNQIAAALTELRALGCNSVGLDSAGSYSVDVPEKVSMHRVDAILSKLDSDLSAVAYPSMRHPE